MSHVIPNHVLRVGQSVCMAPKEEGGGFRQVIQPRGIPMTTKYSYFTSEKCVGNMTSQVCANSLADTARYSGQKHNSSSLYKSVEEAPHNPMNAHQRFPESVGTNPHNIIHGSVPEVCNGGDPLSPSLDISIDNLNQLILQLDPTFKPLPLNSELVVKRHEPCSQGTVKTTCPTEIKCGRVNSTRVVCQENIQRSSSPTPKVEGILIARGTQNCTPNSSLIFGESQSHVSGHQGHHQYPSAASSYQTTEIIAVPLQRSRQYNPTISTSLGSDSSHDIRPSFFNNEGSFMSTSPGSDTSYILGSTQSLQYDDFDGHQFPSRLSDSPFGSLGSFSNLNSPSIMSTTTSIHHFEHKGSFDHKSKTFPRTPTNGHANSCPPSVNNSIMDIPILLVNGCLENGDSSPKSSRRFLGGNRRKSSSTFNKTCSESSIPTCSDSTIKEGQHGMKFVMDTSKHWFKANITRDQAIEFLKDKVPGTFIIRDSTSYRGSFGLAMKVPGMPSKTGNTTNELVRHFLIESSAKGVHLKGVAEEPYFGSLSALVYQHTITPLSLPCKLLIPDKAHSDCDSSPDSFPDAVSELKSSAACNVLYLNSVSTETLTGSNAIQKAVTATFERADLTVPTIVNFKATEQGVTLTDVQRKVFFRRFYPVSSLSFCSVDPELRKWQKHCKSSRIFGFVAKNPSDPSDNVCHVFAEYDVVQPASLIISFLSNLIKQQERV
ncbi:tensin-4 [Pseudophryne corroboree]|uniref:tensin-4 n=1 Tax=Pseudophryne corroboree TaxID=495146 RepID=UPI003081E931